MAEKLLEVDSRKRVTLGDLATHRYYLVRAEEDGTIILTPAVVVPATKETANRLMPVIPWQGRPQAMFAEGELPPDTQLRDRCRCSRVMRHTVHEACNTDLGDREGRNSWSPPRQATAEDREQMPPHVVFNAA